MAKKKLSTDVENPIFAFLNSAAENDTEIKNKIDKKIKDSIIEYVNVNDVSLDDKFSTIFERPERMINILKEDFAQRYENGLVPFHPEEPIVVWKKNNIVIDGCTRKIAWESYISENKELTEEEKLIPVVFVDFADEKEALQYAIKRQFNRRQLSEEKILEIAEYYTYTLPKAYGSGSKAEKLADTLGVSKSTAKKSLNVSKNATEEQKEAIKNGEKTINQVNKEIVNQKKTDNSDFEEEDDDDISDDLDDNSENPAALSSFNHSDGKERPSYSPTESTDIDEWTIEKNKQVESAKKEGYAKGFEAAVYFCLGEIAKGKTPQELFNDSRLSDFSPSVIWNFEVPQDDIDIVGGF